MANLYSLRSGWQDDEEVVARSEHSEDV